MNIKEYFWGTSVTVYAEFKNRTGSFIDPTTVAFSYKKPGAVEVTKTYGVDGEVIKEDVGKYYIDLDADTVGFWGWRAWSTGTGQAAYEGQFKIKGSQFD